MHNSYYDYATDFSASLAFNSLTNNAIAGSKRPGETWRIKLTVAGIVKSSTSNIRNL
jgi:hypothetical protein